MKLTRVEIADCRNLRQVEFCPGEGLTVIAGPNGQGKTNLLECIWLLTGSKSFRGARDVELVREGESRGRVCGETANRDRENRIEITIAGQGSEKRGRFARVNGVEYGRAAAIAGVFTSVVFEPGHLHLIKGGPEGRRRFLDAALCQLYPGYLAVLRRFNRALAQKNALLKQSRHKTGAGPLLDAFDAELAAAGGEMIRRRQAYLDRIGPAAEAIYRELAGGGEQLRIHFAPCCEAEALPARLAGARTEDLRAGYSTTGPQRDDFETTIHGRPARNFGSQGQQRSAVISLKLAEAAEVCEVTGEHPVILLDDVLSELDEGRQGYLLSRMAGRQVLVSACDTAVFSRAGGLLCTMQAGELTVR